MREVSDEREVAGATAAPRSPLALLYIAGMIGPPLVPRVQKRLLRRLALCAAVILGVACSADEQPAVAAATTQRGLPPDELPRMLNAEPPFRYPPALYAQKTQANVLLRLFVDSVGVVVRESTMVVESSGVAELDSAAVTGATELNFDPARRNGARVGTMVLLPVHFRHPDGPRLPGDSLPAVPVTEPAGDRP